MCIYIDHRSQITASTCLKLVGLGVPPQPSSYKNAWALEKSAGPTGGCRPTLPSRRRWSLGRGRLHPLFECRL